MVDLSNVDLLAMQSRYMRRDVTTRALCAALTPLLRELAGLTDLVVIYPRIDQLTGAVLDILAWGFHVDGYDALAGDEEKRSMIKNSFLIHRYKGTVYAVRKIVEGVFGEDGKIEEWFQYAGSPYHFSVDVYCSTRGVTAADQLRAVQLVKAGKNLRSELDGLNLILSQGATQKVAAAVSCGELIEVYPIGDSDTVKLRIASAAVQSTTIEVYEREGQA